MTAPSKRVAAVAISRPATLACAEPWFKHSPRTSHYVRERRAPSCASRLARLARPRPAQRFAAPGVIIINCSSSVSSSRALFAAVASRRVFTAPPFTRDLSAAAGGVGVFNDDYEDDDLGVDDGIHEEGNDDEEDVDVAAARAEIAADEAAESSSSSKFAASASAPGASFDDDATIAAEKSEDKADFSVTDDDAVVLGGPVCDAFSNLVLELRAGGHGEKGGAGSSSDEASVSQVSSWSNPTPWSTFSGMRQYEVKACLGDVRRTLKAYAAHAAPPGALSERLMGAVGAAWLETAAAHADGAAGEADRVRVGRRREVRAPVERRVRASRVVPR